jgi:TolB-like protein
VIGTTVSHYRVLESLGRGGMGEVFRGEDLRLHRPVALKILRRAGGSEDEERNRLLREARAASALNHPNIAVVYDVAEADSPEGKVFLLAMEYVPGKSLADLISGPVLPLDTVLDLMEQAADALADAHAHGVVHGDIKPSNLMVAQGRLKVLDFGLARTQPRALADTLVWDGEDGSSPHETFAGTPFYMSPEQALGKDVDGRTDIFSLGVVFYELLAGRRPFDGEGFVQVADAILHRDPPSLPPRYVDPRLPKIERILARMLTKEIAARAHDLAVIRVELGRLRVPAPVASPAGSLTAAVAGFANITRRAEDDWLGTGLSETVTAALQEIEGLEVWGREQLRESLRRLGAEESEVGPEDAARLGRMVGARWVLGGSFQRLGDVVRVTARVVEAESGQVVRAVKMDGRIQELFDLQDRIVGELAAGLRKTVVAASEGDETQVVEAYEAMAKGLLNIRADSYESLERAILFFERAVALDPGYIRAQIELGAAWAQKADYLTAPELYERAATILRRTLEARPNLPRVWRELGMTQLVSGRVDEGVETLSRALAMAPEDPRMLAGLARAYFIGKADFPRAAELLAKAVERNPEAGWYLMQLAHCQALMRDFERGEQAARRAIELQEAFLSGQQGVHLVGAYMRLGHLHSLQGRHREAVDALASEIAFIERMDHALRSRIRVELHCRRGASLLALGEAEEAEIALDAGLDAFGARLRLGADEPFTRYYAAAIHALRREADDALGLLESSVRDKPAFMIARCRIEPEWDGLRDHPRFRKLLDAMEAA